MLFLPAVAVKVSPNPGRSRSAWAAVARRIGKQPAALGRRFSVESNRATPSQTPNTLSRSASASSAAVMRPRALICSFLKMRTTCVSTVRSAMPNAAAIWLFVLPCATNCAIALAAGQRAALPVQHTTAHRYVNGIQ